ncbi:MAG: sirohydrochlorin chelatase [Planctomycetota bacterium]
MSSCPTSPRLGYLIVGHGTRDLIGQSEFHLAVSRIAELCPSVVVRACFLELVEPTISDAIDGLVRDGVERVVVAPLLLFAAGHAKRDVPEAVEAARQRYPTVSFAQADHLGCHTALLELSARRFLDAQSLSSTTASLLPHPMGVPNGTLWVMVGRGSLDAEATAEFERFTQMRRAWTPIAEAWNAYLAMAKPTLREVLARAEAAEYARVVVQPHLLFAGELLVTARELVRASAERSPDREWLWAGHLGPAEQVAAAVVDRCRESELRAWPTHDCGGAIGEE